MIQLNPKQELAKERIMQFLHSDDSNVIILTGSAGTGKTATISAIMKDYKNLDKINTLVDPDYKTVPWYITATTNKAKQALVDNLRDVEVSTIHSLLGLSVYKGGLHQRNTSKLPDKAILVIDECSMIGDNPTPTGQSLKFYLDKLPKTVKIIYVGDQYQLAPVKHSYAPVFLDGHEIIQLTQTMRQVNAPNIAELCEKFKEYVRADDATKPLPLIELSSEVTHVSADAFNDLIKQVFITEEQSTNDHRVLSYSNKVVQYHNKHLFAAKNGRKNFAIGDTVLVNQYVRGLKTDEQVTIRSSDEVRIDNKPVGRIYEVIGDTNIVNVFSPTNYAKTLKYLESRVEDPDVFHSHQDKYLYECIADLRPLYACTVHKSQGSTFDTVYIDLNPFKYVRNQLELARLLYVALSRASNKVVLTGDI